MAQTAKKTVPKQGPDLDQIKEQLKPRLKEYLQQKGAVFVGSSRFHCIFNPSQHSHGDKNASGSIKDNGFTCFTCGAKGDIFSAVNQLEGRPISGKGFIDTCRYLCELFSIPFPESEGGKLADRDDLRPVANYIYTSMDGKPIYRVIRFHKYRFGKPIIGKKGKVEKTFSQETFDPKTGEWVKGLDSSVTRVLYRLPDVASAIEAGETIYLCEGEKCAEIVHEKLGVTATCINSGAKGWIKPHTRNFIMSLVDADLVILPDNDAAGKRFAETVADDVLGVVQSVKVIDLPGIAAGQDIEEWLLLHPDSAKVDLDELISRSQQWAREKPQKDALASTIIVERGCYWRLGEGKKEDACISNFIIHPIRKIVPDDPFVDAVWNVRVEGPEIDPLDIDLKLDCFIDRKAFKKTFQHESLSFRGNDNDLQDIKRLFSKETHEEKRGVSYSGIHVMDDGKCCFVSRSRCIDASGATIDDIMLLENNEQLHTSILEASELTGDKVENGTFIRNLFAFNDLKRTATIIGWACSCFLSEQLFNLGIKQPHIFITGEAGSGKSQTVESVLMPIFSLCQKFAAGQLTEFVAATASSSTNTIPLIIDEYKPHFIGQKKVGYVSELLRNTYERSELRRGKADLSLKIYRYKAPVAVVGEAGTVEAAIKERGLELGFEKKSTLQPARTAAFMALKKSPDKLHQLGFSLLMTAMSMRIDNVKSLFEAVQISTEPRIKEKIPAIAPRIADSICCCISGLCLLEFLLIGMGLDIHKITGASEKDLHDAVIDAVKEYVMDEQGSTKSAVDQILETMARMASQNLYVKGIDYAWKRGHDTLMLDIKGMYDRYLKYHADFRLTHESVDYATFSRQLGGKVYCKGTNITCTFSKSQEPLSTRRKGAQISVYNLDGVDLGGFGVEDVSAIFDEDEDEDEHND